jgi:lysophospholipase L1-like esterase
MLQVIQHRKGIRPQIRRPKLSLCIAALSVTLPLACASDTKFDGSWVATWSTSNMDVANPVMAGLMTGPRDFREFSNQTIREIVHTTVAGSVTRLRLANTFGSGPVTFDAIYIGTQSQSASVVTGSNHVVTFGGATSVAIPEGADALSDVIPMPTAAQQNVAISLYISKPTGPATFHASAFQTNYVSVEGNHVAEEGGEAFTKKIGSWFFLASVEVLAAKQTAGAIVALGDSITDGASSRPDANERWTDVLARRLNGNSSQSSFAVLNAGIGGNRVLSSSPCFGENALARLNRDVFASPGVRSVILFEGTNDIGQPDTHAEAKYVPCLAKTHVTAGDLIAGYQQIIAQVHARHLKIFGATILPFKGFNGWTEKGEATRLEVNKWIKESRAFDGVIDFSAALTDPENPAKLAAKYDSGDHLHPGTEGHAAMALAIDLSMLTK